jgi:hypothetical protein
VGRPRRPSSFWRKSTAINSAESLLRSSAPDAVLPSDFSREKFLEILGKTPAGMLTLKEFGGFLAALGRDYMGGMKETLTELYDGPDEYSRSLKSSTFTVKRPALTLLAATTLDWFEGRIDEGDLRGGFLARFLFVTAKHKASPKGLTGGMDPVSRVRLQLALHQIACARSERSSSRPRRASCSTSGCTAGKPRSWGRATGPTSVASPFACRRTP